MLFLVRSTERGKEPHQAKSKQRQDIAACLLAEVPDARLTFDVGRAYVEVDRDITDVLSRLHGVSSFSPCTTCDLDALEAHAIERAREALPGGGSIRVKVRRRGEHAFSASTLAAQLGAKILAALPGSRVDLRAPDVTIAIEIKDRACFVCTKVIPGLDARGEEPEPAPARPDGAAVSDEPKFLVDAMLGTLASRLRALGYDTVWRRDTADSLLLREAHAEGRLLLTQDRELSEIGGARALFVNAKTAAEQLDEVVARLALAPDPARLFTRCSLCNAPLVPAEKASVAERVPPRALAHHDAFWTCPSCDKVYWKGSHYDEMLAALKLPRR